jgi:hypothetical protein
MPMPEMSASALIGRQVIPDKHGEVTLETSDLKRESDPP